jgi:hypothetical protein
MLSPDVTKKGNDSNVLSEILKSLRQFQVWLLTIGSLLPGIDLIRQINSQRRLRSPPAQIEEVTAGTEWESCTAATAATAVCYNADSIFQANCPAFSSAAVAAASRLRDWKDACVKGGHP